MPYSLVKTIPFGLLLLFCGITSCPAGDGTLADKQSTEPLLHSIHSDQLRRTMLRLKDLAYEREYTELRLDRLRSEQIESLVVEARALVAKAGRLPEIMNGGTLNAEEQITFIAVAKQLYGETQQLQADVLANRYENLQYGYRHLQQTCNACHKLFRIND